MDSKPDHRWLMHYQIVNLVNQCRRLIKAEFDVALSLTDPELRQRLAHYAGHSRAQGLQRVYGELRLALIKLEGPDPQPAETKKPPKMRYRGQPLAASDNTPTSRKGSRRTLVYRGRVVET